jgi:menaquinone-dependent protoporphyrinogen IX oxidase
MISLMMEEFENLDFDAFIIGSSVYDGKVQAKLLDFIEAKENELGRKPIAAFIVCKEVEHPRQQNLVQILNKILTEPIAEQRFEGYILRKGDFEKQKRKAENWVKEFVSKMAHN